MGSAREVPAERGEGGELNGSSSHRDHIDCDAIDSSLEEVPEMDDPSAGDGSAESRGIDSKGGDHMELEQQFFEVQPKQKT